MGNKPMKMSMGATMEQFKIVAAYGSLFRMDVRNGKTWILFQKELIWKCVPEEEKSPHLND
jgi:hypothetical protein